MTLTLSWKQRAQLPNMLMAKCLFATEHCKTSGTVMWHCALGSKLRTRCQAWPFIYLTCIVKPFTTMCPGKFIFPNDVSQHSLIHLTHTHTHKLFFHQPARPASRPPAFLPTQAPTQTHPHIPKHTHPPTSSIQSRAPEKHLYLMRRQGLGGSVKQSVQTQPSAKY
jgi:hypothetical protein